MGNVDAFAAGNAGNRLSAVDGTGLELLVLAHGGIDARVGGQCKDHCGQCPLSRSAYIGGQTRLGGVNKCFGADCLCQREINIV